MGVNRSNNKQKSKQSVKLSDLQLSVMRVLWKHGKLSVSETHKQLNQKKLMALTTVATLLTRMQEKDIVAFEKRGRQFLYYPLISESDIKTSMLTNILNTLFDGNPSELVNHLVSQNDIKKGDLDKIKQLLQKDVDND